MKTVVLNMYTIFYNNTPKTAFVSVTCGRKYKISWQYKYIYCLSY